MSSAPVTTFDAARQVDPARYAMHGTPPATALRPESRDEVSEALRAAARERLGVVPWGAGTALAHEPAPARYDLALDLTALDKVVEYEPDDLTFTAECGVTIASLRAMVAARNHELPLEAPQAEHATLGGVIAANASGARRYRYGAPRDRILGARFALADGTLARTGGKVVKNVAGYAMHRLACGSRGGLAVVLEASFKLATAPATRELLAWPVDAAGLEDGSRWAQLPRLEPAAVTVVSHDLLPRTPASIAAFASHWVLIGLEDDAAWVEVQRARLRAALGDPAWRVEGPDTVTWWQNLADLELSDRPRLTFATADNTPSALAPLNSILHGARTVFHAPAGRLHAFAAESEAPGLIDALATRGFALIDTGGVGEARGAGEPQPAVAALRARLRSELDPAEGLSLGARWITSR